MSNAQILCSLVAALLPFTAVPGAALEATPGFVLKNAPTHQLPGVADPKLQKVEGGIDCNNPSHWDGDTMYLFSSWGAPYRSEGPSLEKLSRPSTRTRYNNEERYNGGRWIESTHKVKGGKLYGWYHREPGGLCGETRLTAPRVGAVVSEDNGMNWRDLDTVLQCADDAVKCDTVNKYFAGGNGDFSVLLDEKGQYFYFLISTYHKDPAEQGISIARMRYEDRDAPQGKIFKWHKGKWEEPGIGGRVTPIFASKIDWHRENADAFWGPSIHYNTYLKQYVILMNRTKDKNWAQEGTYITFNPDISDPTRWSEPKKVYDGGPWYPQVVGINAAEHETDKRAGRVARLFLRGRSEWELVFLRPQETKRDARQYGDDVDLLFLGPGERAPQGTRPRQP